MTEQEIIERAAKVLKDAHVAAGVRRGLTFREEVEALHAAGLLRTALDDQAVSACEGYTNRCDVMGAALTGYLAADESAVYAAGRASLALKAAQQAAREPKWRAWLHRSEWRVVRDPREKAVVGWHGMILTEPQAQAIAAALNADAEGKS